MKKALSAAILLFLFIAGFSQNMWVKKPNLTGFTYAAKKVTPSLDTMSSQAARKHPEYGLLPYNAQCAQCAELVDRRTMNTRFFIDPYVPSHTFSQQSYFPLHYKTSRNGIWQTIDPRLRTDANEPGVYRASQQPIPTKCDLNKKSVSIKTSTLEFEFDKNLTMYYIDGDDALSKAEQGNYSNYTMGEQGLAVSNMWPDIDMQQVFSVGDVKTSYIIKKPLQIPVSKGYMVIEDHFSLPAGYKVAEAAHGEHMPDKGFRGSYNIQDDKGNTLITYTRPVYIDFNAVGIHGIYNLIQKGNDYTLQTLVPVNWLTREENVYPLTIDPLVTPGDSAYGNFIATGLPTAHMGFTSVPLGTCDYHMSVTVPGMSQLTNALINIEYKLTYSDSCGSPPEPIPYCLFHQVNQYVVCDHCNDQIPFHCNNIGDTTGLCTTDSFTRNNVFHSLSPATYTAAQFLPCYAPQCPNYDIPFTLKNTDSICGDVCGFLCARGTMWEITIEACTVDGNITQNKTRVCAGQSAIFTAHPNCGVPPYHYVWTPDGGNTFDTVYASADYVVTTTSSLNHNDSVFIECYIVDSCGNLAATNVLQLNIIPSPAANAGPDKYLCRGGNITLGGNPTTTGATTIWTGSDATVQGWLSSNQVANPGVSVPPGTVDTFFYALKTTNALCFNTDTVFVYSTNGDAVAIDTTGSTRLCAGQSVKLFAQGGPFVSYSWNVGGNDSTIHASQAGPYFLIVKDTLGCTDTSNVITISTVGAPTVHVYPDTLIQVGDSVMLYSDLNLGSASIDSFTWYPSVNISCLTCSNPLVAPTADQYYGLIVHSQGCTVTDSALIQVILPNNFFIPNVFTPNGDGNNDNFYIETQSGVTVILFQVFDRWGEKVHDGPYPWNGTYKGKPAPPGVYVYMFKLQLYGRDLAVFRKGSVTLLK